MSLEILPLGEGRRLFYWKLPGTPPISPAKGCLICAAGLDALVKRPWGFWHEIATNVECSVRLLHVAPSEMLSNQRHQRRDELYFVLDPGALVKLSGAECSPCAGDLVYIPRNTWHRLVGAAGTEVRVLEVSFGEYDQDNDIERNEDKYGRQLSGPGTGAR